MDQLGTLRVAQLGRMDSGIAPCLEPSFLACRHVATRVGTTKITSCYNQVVGRPASKASPFSMLLACCVICVNCTFLNSTDYLGKDYGTPSVPDAGPCGEAAGVIFCEDFEGANAPDQQRWTSLLTASAASLEIDKTLHHGGVQSLHAKLAIDTAGADNPAAQLNHAQSFPRHFFARFYLYANSAEVQTPEAIMNFQMHDGSAGVQVALQKNWQPNLPAAVAFEFWGNTSGGFQVANPLTYGRWECIQWEVDEDGANVNVALNGGDVLSTPVTSIAPYDVLAVGVAFSGAMSAGTYEAWIDDVVVGTTPIGCGG